MASINLQEKLDLLFATIKDLSPSSSATEFEKFGAFFAPDCKAWLKNMREYDAPAIGRQSTVDKLKEIMTEKYWSIGERQVLSSSVTPDGLQVFSETKKRLVVCGVPIDPFYEMEIAVFNSDGLITELKLYSCWSPVVSVIQQKTGKGPYAVANYKAKTKV